jgi:uncharacterized protein (TIGR02246 family)
MPKAPLLVTAAMVILGACTTLHGAHPMSATSPDASASSEPVADADTLAVAQANFGRWESALATRDPAQIAALFTPTAVLAPTVSNQVRDTPAQIEAYFVDFVKLSPRPEITERALRRLDENTLLDAGVWRFTLVDGGQTSSVTARYSFVWERVDGVWMIALLHSSMMPEGADPA